MKKQKLVKVLALFTMSAAAISCAAVIGCKKPGSVPHTHTYADEYSYDESGHWYAATCGHDDEKKDFEAHVYDGDDDDDCNICNYVRHNFESAWHYNVDGHWHECTFDGCEETVYSAHDFNEQGICNDCGAQFATYEFIPSELEDKTYSSAYTSGLFTILADTTVRTRSRENYSVYDWANGQGTSADEPVEKGFYASKSVQYNGEKRGISVNAIAPGRLTIYVDNGSGGKTKQDLQTILLTKPNGSTEVISYYCGDMYAITIDCDTVGTYKITRGNATGVGTTDLYYAKFETVVDVTPVADIKIVDGGKVNYIKGENFDSSKLQINIIHETTMLEEPLSLNAEGLEIDYSEFDGNKAGTYTIYVTYKVDGNTFNDEYEVTVYDVENIELGFNKIVQGGNTAAGNGQYINQSVKQFYFRNEDLDLTGLTVKTITDNGKQSTIVTEGFEVTGFTKGQAGKQTVTVEWKDNPEIKATFDVYVVNYTAASVTASQSITVSVNGSYDDTKVGVLENGAYQFKTIQQSLEFLNALNLNQNTHKIINLAPGTYTEKLEINIPNLAIYGDTSNPESTVIEWDALVGIADESGYVHITDSSATLNVREKAVGFVIEGVTISNWYNSEEHFTQVFGPNYGEHRALAMLIQADKVVIDNCRLLGYQDTIELFTGRQYILNTYICGRTDFIFGTNNTTYFYNCEIESIVNGGYVTAFKGNNKGDSDWVQYGAIFDECKFTAPASVIAAKDTSLGRTWGKYAAVAYVNCDFAGHICTVPYGTSGAKNTRYTAMSGNEPTTGTVKFVEYNNTGAGAVNQSITGMTYLTAEEAAKYSDLSIIFGTKNGLVTYADSWDGSKGVEITTVDYRFGDYYSATDSYTYHDIPAGGEEILGGLATITGTKWGHELNQSKDQAKFDVGCVIQFSVAGKVTVTTYGSSYGLPENIKIVYVNGVATITIVATESSPLNNGCYITLIQVNTKEKPAHEHDYGEWTISAPSADATGTAERTCQNCEEETAHVDRVTLPKLSETDYTITSGTGGNVTYTYKADETISFEAAPLAGLHVHSYGDWTVTATLESAGTATKICTAGGDCDVPTVSINLPALTDSRYTITNNTATTEAKGTGTYTIEINGETITFEAETAKLEMAYIEASTNYYFKDNNSYAETINAGETANYNGLIISGNSGSFKPNGGSAGNWYVIAGDATLELKIHAGTTVQVVIGYCQDCLSFAFDGTAVSEGTAELTKSEYAGNVQTYTFVASADGVLSISKTPTATGTAYIGYIYVTV
ncbi:MAG: bacterial Ig-like domain-containing protein [Clostridia bacterium]|nr:bacterial Ig-like domain-containing protein [Clostridia bacterium]